MVESPATIARMQRNKLLTEADEHVYLLFS